MGKSSTSSIHEEPKGGLSKRKFRTGSLFIFTFSFLFSLGCGREPQPAPIPADRIVVIRGRENPPTLDPAYAARTFDGHLCCLVHGGLVRANERGEVIPELAESWSIEEEGRLYRFRIRKGLTFPSGRPLDASAAAGSWNRICSPETASPVAWVFEDVTGWREAVAGEVKGVAGFVPKGSHELEVHLTAPSSSFLARLTMPAARLVDLAEVEAKGAGYGRNPVALGAWQLSDWEDDSHLLFRPNPNYPEANRKIAGIRFDLITKDFSASARFEAGSLHILNPLPSSQAAYWKRFRQWENRIHPAQQLNLYYIGFGCHRPPFDDPGMRKALRKAMGIDEVRAVIHGSKAEPVYGPIPPGLIGSSPARSREKALNDQERDLLSGLEMEMWFPDIDPTAALVMEGIQANLARWGVKVRLRRLDRTAYTAWRRQGRFEAFLGNWWADFPDPDNFITPLFRSDSDSNTTRFSDAEVDRLADEARREVNVDRRAELYGALADRLWEEAPMVFLWRLNEEVLTQPWVEGFTPPTLFQGTLYLDLSIAEQPPPRLP